MNSKEKKSITIEKLIEIVNYISDKINLSSNIRNNVEFNLYIKDIEREINIDFSKIIKISKQYIEKENSFKVWGKLKKINKDHYEIEYSDEINYIPKQLFTIAHEYVHFIIDQILLSNVIIQNFEFQEINDGETLNRSSEKYEYIIESLSSKLIVSDEKFNKFIENRKMSQELLFDISKTFNLSLSAAEIRYEENY